MKVHLNLLLTLFVAPLAAQAQFDFTHKSDGTVAITRYTGPGGSVSIPSSIYVPAVTNSLPVTSIEMWYSFEREKWCGAFWGCSSMTEIVIPGTITNIGIEAFADCTGLNEVTIPGSVINVGMQAFYGCTNLQTVVAGSGVTSIGDYAFGACYGLTSFAIPNSVTNLGQAVFSSCSSLADLTIPDGFISIPRQMCLYCRSLTNLNVPDSVISIGDGAFRDCTNLCSVALGNGLASIGFGAFRGCLSLTNIVIPSSVVSLGSETFRICPRLTSVFFEGNAPAFGDNVFHSDVNAIVYYLPGTTGWSSWVGGSGGRPALPWNPLLHTGGAPSQNSIFEMTITGTANMPIVLEASTSLTGENWSSLLSCTVSNGSINVADPYWTNYSRRYYRVRSP